MRPIATGLMGLCPLLAKSTTLLSALTLALAFAAALCCSALSLSLVRRLAAPPIAPAITLLMAATWVTAVDLALQAWAYPMHDWLGIYIPLLAGNCLLLSLLDEHALVQDPGTALKEASVTALRLGAFVVAAGLLRELVATGGVFSDARLIDGSGGTAVVFSPLRMPLMASAAGAYFAFSIIAAVVNCPWPRRGAG